MGKKTAEQIDHMEIPMVVENGVVQPKQVIVLSDTHGRSPNIQWMIEQNPSVDTFIHLGDYVVDGDFLRERNHDFTVIQVKGNNDVLSDQPEKCLIESYGHRILAMHGHQYQARDRAMKLMLLGQSLNVEMVLVGHSHVAQAEVFNGVHVYNPGSLGLPRDGGPPSYLILTLTEERIDHEFAVL